jgi:hypothetical protein
VGQTDASTVQLFPRNGVDPIDGRPAAQDALALASAVGASGATVISNGTMSWQSARIYYLLPDQHELWRLQINFAQASASVPNPMLPAAVVAQLKAGQPPSAPGAMSRRLASNVRSMQFRGVGWPQIVTLGCSEASYSLSVETGLMPVLMALNPNPAP